MSFGKRDPNAPVPPRPIPGADPTLASGRGPVAVAEPGNQGQTGFIILVLAVFLIAGALAFVAPSLGSGLSSLFQKDVPLRAIPVIVANLDHDQAKKALAKEAFPDKQGRAFMSTLAAKFPEEHDRLLDQLATAAMKGGERDDLILEMNKWIIEFTPMQMEAIGRTGARGFDAIFGIANDALDALETMGDGKCNAQTLQTLAMNPDELKGIGAYGTPIYKLNMRAGRTLVTLAAEGQDAPRAPTNLRAIDQRALGSVVRSLMNDRRILELQTTAMMGNMTGRMPDINVCELGRVVLDKLGNLPSGTKARLLGLGTSQMGSSVARMGAMQPFGGY